MPHTPPGMAILEPKNKGQNRQTMHLRFIYGIPSLRHMFTMYNMVCTSSNKFLLGVIVKYCQFPRHKCFLLQNLLTKKLHNCGHFGQCTVLHIDYLYRQEGQKWSIIWWLVATHSLSQAVYTVNVYRVSPQHTQSFPLMSIGFLCDSYSPFP